VLPLTVTFTNTSTGDYTSSLWDFGDGITSTLTSPTHTYTAAGGYTVTLTVSDGLDSSTITHTNYITVYAPVRADFTASPTSGLAPLTVVFTNTSSGDYTSSLWDFGDVATSTLESPTHIYTAGGVYTVTLTVSGPGGSDTETKEGYITVRYGLYLPLIVRNR
jgi:PKD repeat protein